MNEDGVFTGVMHGSRRESQVRIQEQSEDCCTGDDIKITI